MDKQNSYSRENACRKQRHSRTFSRLGEWHPCDQRTFYNCFQSHSHFRSHRKHHFLSPTLILLLTTIALLPTRTEGQVSCQQPGYNEIIAWRSESIDVNVTWRLDQVCSSTRQCYGPTAPQSQNQPLDAQLCPVQLQFGDRLYLLPPPAGSPYTTTVANVTEAAFYSCPSRAYPEDQILRNSDPFGTLQIPARFLQAGVLYLAQHPDGAFSNCNFGLRLQVLIKEQSCRAMAPDPGGSQGDGQVLCSGRGVCGSKFLEERYRCYCYENYRGQYCSEFDACAVTPCKNGGRCVDGDEGLLGSTFICICAEGYTGPDCTEVLGQCSPGVCGNGSCVAVSQAAFKCDCREGFSGTFCDKFTDMCTPNPCLNQGVCVTQLLNHVCLCRSGFTGRNCEINIDECASNPCAQGATCVDEINGFYCRCPPGFDSDFCFEPINFCNSNPCENNAECVGIMNGYLCNCTLGFQGDRCETVVSRCSQVPDVCKNGGHCLQSPGGPVQCQCSPGWTGATCEKLDNLCRFDPCPNHTICVDTSTRLRPGTYACSCPPGFTGDKCQVEIAECSSNPCLNDGVCVDRLDGYQCICTAAYTGTNCENNIDACAGRGELLCHNNATCVDGNTGFNYSCACAPGFTNFDCGVEIDECASNPCLYSGTCMDRVNGYLCQCADGFSGRNCENFFDYCSLNPCANGAQCVPRLGSYSCECTAGWAGRNCTEDVDECQSSPCLNGATCQNLQNRFRCICAGDYLGTLCETSLDNCRTDSCFNGGTCVDLIDDFRCECKPGYIGRDCGTEVIECISAPCQNGGICQDRINGYQCFCNADLWGGPNCEIALNNCSSAPCQNGATCRPQPPTSTIGFICQCAPVFTGRFCEARIALCSSNPCLNGATCSEDVDKGTYSCVCSTGFTGDRCQTDIDFCEGNQCRNGATCRDLLTGYTCQCPSGFAGQFCETGIDPCASSPCRNNAVCVKAQDDPGYQCFCPNGFTGLDCSKQVNECDSFPCLNNALCIDGVNRFTCICESGFQGSRCEINRDDCLNNNCKNGAVCIDGLNEYACQCRPGYIGSDCSFEIDECLSSPCNSTGTLLCTDRIADYSCRCKPGYTGRHCEVDINECLSDPCQNGAICRDQLDSYRCTCIPGTTGVNCETVIDHCASGPCGIGTCQSALNGYRCICPSDGRDYDDNCQPILPCRSNPCQNQATCVNEGAGGFRCLCRHGFTGADCGEADYCKIYNVSCANGGLCVSIDGNFTCVCTAGFVGRYCERNVDECARHICQNGALCVDGDGGYTCRCRPGFVGRYCQDVATSCVESPCYNNATCLSTPNFVAKTLFTCMCPPAYEGAYCERESDACASDPCRNGGSCSQERGFFECACKPGYTGRTCSENIDECIGNGCQNGATCIDRINGYICDCPIGFAGNLCQDEVNECSSAPCLNGGRCVDETDGYQCFCRNGFTGLHCEVDYNECLSDPCLNGATCLDLAARFECRCPLGVTGILCETNIDECSSSPCRNGATCTDLFGGYNCTCHPGYTGRNCETDIDECASDPCMNGGTCRDRTGLYICDCVHPFRGVNCNLLPCDLNPCESGGTCFNDLSRIPDGFRCECIPGLAGTRCQSNVDDCVTRADGSVPCSGRGLCLDDINKYTCLCNPGWKGKDCEVPIDECTDNQCRNSATCVNLWRGYRCVCSTGFEGQFCERETDECQPEPCVNGGTCVDLHNDYRCLCREGWTGKNCEREVNECILTGENPCQNGGTCIDGFASFRCQCAPFYTGSRCEVRYDPCGNDFYPCKQEAVCRTNSDGTYTCLCPQGYTGTNCEIDIDECASAPCMNGQCEDRPNSYRCYCPLGYTGNQCEVNIDDCIHCKNGATCQDFVNGYICTCSASFTGQNCTEDVNECDESPCKNGGTCVNTFGGFSCDCKVGYTGDQCETDIDECASEPCQNGALCRQGFGDFTCFCQLGYTGKFCQIDIDECASNPCGNGECLDRVNGYICECHPGWTGENCLQQIDECTSIPCANSGLCVDQVNGYRCVCLAGYTGPNCEIDIEVCQRDGVTQCLNGGTCSEGPGDTFNCLCKSGYTGRFCELDVDECASSPCKAGSTCQDQINGYQCICSPGFTGSDCSVDINECVSSPCFNKGICQELAGGGYECLCRSGLGGVHCEINYDDCLSSPCLNSGTCVDGLNSYTCICPSQTTGRNCEALLVTPTPTLKPSVTTTGVVGVSNSPNSLSETTLVLSGTDSTPLVEDGSVSLVSSTPSVSSGGDFRSVSLSPSTTIAGVETVSADAFTTITAPRPSDEALQSTNADTSIAIGVVTTPLLPDSTLDSIASLTDTPTLSLPGITDQTSSPSLSESQSLALTQTTMFETSRGGLKSTIPVTPTIVPTVTEVDITMNMDAIFTSQSEPLSESVSSPMHTTVISGDATVVSTSNFDIGFSASDIISEPDISPTPTISVDKTMIMHNDSSTTNLIGNTAAPPEVSANVSDMIIPPISVSDTGSPFTSSPSNSIDMIHPTVVTRDTVPSPFSSQSNFEQSVVQGTNTIAGPESQTFVVVTEPVVATFSPKIIPTFTLSTEDRSESEGHSTTGFFPSYSNSVETDPTKIFPEMTDAVSVTASVGSESGRTSDFQGMRTQTISGQDSILTTVLQFQPSLSMSEDVSLTTESIEHDSLLFTTPDWSTIDLAESIFQTDLHDSALFLHPSLGTTIQTSTSASMDSTSYSINVVSSPTLTTDIISPTQEVESENIILRSTDSMDIEVATDHISPTLVSSDTQTILDTTSLVKPSLSQSLSNSVEEFHTTFIANITEINNMDTVTPSPTVSDIGQETSVKINSITNDPVTTQFSIGPDISDSVFSTPSPESTESVDDSDQVTSITGNLETSIPLRTIVSVDLSTDIMEALPTLTDIPTSVSQTITSVLSDSTILVGDSVTTVSIRENITTAVPLSTEVSAGSSRTEIMSEDMFITSGIPEDNSISLSVSPSIRDTMAVVEPTATVSVTEVGSTDEPTAPVTSSTDTTQESLTTNGFPLASESTTSPEDLATASITSPLFTLPDISETKPFTTGMQTEIAVTNSISPSLDPSFTTEILSIPSLQTTIIDDSIFRSGSGSVSLSPATFTPIISIEDSQRSLDEVNVSIIPTISINYSQSLSEEATLSITPTITIEDSSSSSDEVAVSITPTINIEDSLNLSDEATVSITPTISIGDSEWSSDGHTTAFMTPTISIEDSLRLSDDVTISVTPAISIEDTLRTSDDVTISITPAISIEDSLRTSDDVTISVTPAISIEDTLRTSDDVTISITPAISIEDSLRSSDDVTISVTPAISIEDTLRTSDDVTISIRPAISIEDSLRTSDDVTISVTPAISIEDTLRTSDDVTISITPAISIEDSLRTSDDVTISVTPAISIEDSLRTSDDVTISITPAISIEDSLRTSDDMTISVTPAISIEDSLRTSDGASVSIRPTINIEDSQRSSDDASISITPTIRIEDSQKLSDDATVSVTPPISIEDSVRSSDEATFSLTPTISIEASVRSITPALSNTLEDNLVTSIPIIDKTNEFITTTLDVISPTVIPSFSIDLIFSTAEHTLPQTVPLQSVSPSISQTEDSGDIVLTATAELEPSTDSVTIPIVAATVSETAIDSGGPTRTTTVVVLPTRVATASPTLAPTSVVSITPTPTVTTPDPTSTVTVSTTPVPEIQSCRESIEPCFYGGTCIDVILANGTTSYRCLCPERYSGRRCERPPRLDPMKFTGASLLTFDPIPLQAENTIVLTLRTYQSNGVIFYSAKDYSVSDSTHYIRLVIIDGLLVYQFSCVFESFNLESNVRVDDGKQYNITIRQSQDCKAQLDVDWPGSSTTVEIGAPFTFASFYLNSLSTFYIGGIPDHVSYVPGPAANFAGCLGVPRINGARYGFFEARAAVNIADCGVTIPTVPPYRSTEAPPSTTTRPATTQTPLPSCDDITCQNGGTCRELPFSPTGSTRYSCDCPLHFVGRHCEQEIGISFPYFNGQSYLRHADLDLSAQPRNDLYLSFKTRARNGTLLYASSVGQEFVHLFVEDGYLKYQASCGPANVLFVDSRMLVNYDNLTAVNVRQTTEPTSGDCTVTVTVNDNVQTTVTLSLNQPQQSQMYDLGPLYLGGLPQGVAPDPRANPFVNFIGCIRHMQVNGQERLVFQDAIEGRNIQECDVPPCRYTPCYNNATCLPSVDGYTCECLPGYGGALCERTVCDRNPCQHGGTCLHQANIASYTCLCPYGRHGINCEKPLTVTRPRYYGTQLGYMSFTAFPRPIRMDYMFDFRFSFTIEDPAHDGLMIFAGQEAANPKYGADFFAVGIQDGYVHFQFNLGSGLAHIRSPLPVNASSRETHQVHFGRDRRMGYLKVDAQPNITGSAGGTLQGLNVFSNLFVGGYDNFDVRLPTDVVFRDGFKGCLYGVELRSGSNGHWQSPGHVVSGRNVGQCHLSECAITECQNGATCVELGATYRCDCRPGWKGPTCSDVVTPCDVGHDCAEGATCLPLVAGGYTCHCPLGKAGTRCEQEITISDARFVGENSYMSFTHKGSLRFAIDVRLQFKPEVATGLLFYIAEHLNMRSGDFLAVVLQDGHVQLRYRVGTSPTVVITSQTTVSTSTGTWYTATVGRNTTHGYVTLDGSTNFLKVTGQMVGLDVTTPIYIGGVPDLGALAPSAVEDEPSAFEGCVRELVVNKHEYQLNERGAGSGVNIVDCDGSACGYQVCQNGGTCFPRTTSGSGFLCGCTPEYYGTTCETSVLCRNNQCAGGATCLPDVANGNYRCMCPLGRRGLRCQEVFSFSSARFTGDSYIYYYNTEYNDSDVTKTYVSFNFTTTAFNGIMIWNGKAYSDKDDYLGVGIHNGRARVVISLGWFTREDVITDEFINDNRWHSIIVQRTNRRMRVYLDGKLYDVTVPGDFDGLNTGGGYYFGGFEFDKTIRDETCNHFDSAFVGCLRDIHLQADSPPLDLLNKASSGANILSCDNR